MASTFYGEVYVSARTHKTPTDISELPSRYKKLGMLTEAPTCFGGYNNVINAIRMIVDVRGGELARVPVIPGALKGAPAIWVIDTAYSGSNTIRRVVIPNGRVVTAFEIAIDKIELTIVMDPDKEGNTRYDYIQEVKL